MQTNLNRDSDHAQISRGDEREVGGITGDVFHRTVDASRDFWTSPPAISFNVDVLASAKAAGARFVEVLDRESGKVYRASLARIWKHGFGVSNSHGEEIALALEQWNKEDEPKPTAEQLTLWG